MEELGKRHMKMLVKLQDRVLRLLNSMINFGKVIIVTNAKEGWVEYSSYYLLPRVYLLIGNYIPVVSAQEQFGESNRRDPGKWKELAFKSLWGVEGLLERNCLLNLLVIGDAEYEINAGKAFKREVGVYSDKRCLLKLVKLKEEPSALQLIKQLEILEDKFAYLASNQKSLSLQLESKGTAETAEKEKGKKKDKKSKRK